MKNIKQINLDKYLDSNFEPIENGIYKNIEEDHYVFALSLELEENEDSQYPLEDLLDKFFLHVSDFIDEEAFNSSKNLELELGGELEDVQMALESIIGKRIYNSEYTGEDGKTYVKLVIE
ncbi:hypothetical protein OX284_002725 [Flavobacterium sp. SUN046]|uniref:hypothetical protein n=1 Tax=Flavobacterium sp. SUN046 TaxID=3002440 RepID=UPI002DBB0911|nr:hypothetical protein [Flavobacterium sp. SUN046]MEC4048329.1 hypothetical protein [Flavobacterium sp. SUN046]